MIVSWNWLKQYVPLSMSPEELEQRLMMAGLNHEETNPFGDDLAIDLEVTSNRPDCLGHIGIAREVSVLWNCGLQIPAARPPVGKTPVSDLARVRIECPELCSRYTARVIRGVRVGPSPRWLAERLETVGITPINNVVDVSNYVMMECGQPLHTFDYGKLRGPEIVVRRPSPGETIEAIDHKTYRLEPGTCVIADAEVAVAIGGVMGGAGTEVSPSTTGVLVEAADFDPISVRTTARRLSLHSDSSYRFERRVDPEGIDWSSRRCCELILELAGGELASGVLDVGPSPASREPVVLRLSQLKRVLGIDVAPELVRRILLALGNKDLSPANGRFPSSKDTITVIPPSWRRDLTREIDLIEEVARIHGYDKIPEDVSVPMASSAARREDRVVAKIRHALTAAGFDEALTLSAVEEPLSRAVCVWTEAEPLQTLMPVIRGADRLRTSLVPSLLGARRTNEALSNVEIELFEIAKIYLPDGELPVEWWMLAVTSGRDYPVVKGALEAMVAQLNPAIRIESDAMDIPLLDPDASCRLMLGGQMLGYLGRLGPQGLKQFDLRGSTTVAELKLAPLVDAADLVPRHVALSPYPAVTRDLNLVVQETVRWAQIADTVRQNGGADLEDLEYRDTYRNPERLGAGKKSLLFTIALRSKEGTLTNQQADDVRDRIVAACREQCQAELRT